MGKSLPVKRPFLSLAMIVRDEEEYLGQCLTSVANYVDEIIIVDTGSKDATKKIAAHFGAKIFDYKWDDDFAAARNFSFSKATGEWVLWLDADDTVEHPEKLRSICQNAPATCGVVFLNYDYQVDDDGTVRVKQWRDRIIRNNGSITWKGRLHETPVEVRRVTKARSTEANIVHHAKPDRWQQSSDRNLRILEKQIVDEKDNPDPRTMFYLASVYRERGRDDEAYQLYELYLKLSGWDEERAMACIQMAEIAFDRGDDTQAIAHFMQSMRERPDFPNAYVGLGKVYLQLDKPQQALEWIEMGLAKQVPETSMVINPLEYTYKPWMLAAEALFRQGKLKDAVTAAEKAQGYLNNEATEKMVTHYKQVLGHKLATEAYASAAAFLEREGEPEKILPLLDAAPRTLQDNPHLLRIRRKFTEPRVWPKRSVVIYTGASPVGEWGPWSLQDGIGGSEEAIVRLSRQLAAKGYDVTVYSNPGIAQGDYSGVQWKNYWEMDTRDTFDIFVAWRSPWLFDADIKARKVYLWLHDVMEPGEFTPERLAKIHKVIVLSKYHRSLFPNIPDDKIMLSANGIDADEFAADTDVARNPHTVVYQSSHVRGLAHLYDIWPEVKQRVPDAKLRIMYGWDSFVKINKNNPERMEWMDTMKRRLAGLEDAVDLGKVSQQQIVQELLTAGVWAYPCPFPEISCITAMKAQAGGAIPVSSTYAALAETVQHGYRMEMPDWDEKTKAEYTELLVTALQDTSFDREAMMADARKRFSWSAVADQWVEDFNG